MPLYISFSRDSRDVSLVVLTRPASISRILFPNTSIMPYPVSIRPGSIPSALSPRNPVAQMLHAAQKTPPVHLIISLGGSRGNLCSGDPSPSQVVIMSEPLDNHGFCKCSPRKDLNDSETAAAISCGKTRNVERDGGLRKLGRVALVEHTEAHRNDGLSTRDVVLGYK